MSKTNDSDESFLMDPFPEPKKNLAGKLAEVGLEIGYICKDKANTAQGYRYASAEAVLGKANEACFQRGICIQSSAELLRYDVVNDFPSQGKSRTKAVVKLTLAFVDSAEGAKQSYQCEGLGEGADHGDKAVLKANTSALKYALANAFLISWGDDPEADPSTDKDVRKEKKKEEPAKTGLAESIASATMQTMDKVRAELIAARTTLGVEEYTKLRDAILDRQAAIGWGQVQK